MVTCMTFFLAVRVGGSFQEGRGAETCENAVGEGPGTREGGGATWDKVDGPLVKPVPGTGATGLKIDTGCPDWFTCDIVVEVEAPPPRALWV